MRALNGLFLAIAVLAMTACGGGGGSTPTEIEISGVVEAPSGQVAMFENKSMFAKLMDSIVPSAQAIAMGEQPVAGATVELIQIDDAGNQVGDVIATAMTAGDGSYTLKTTRALSSNLVLRVNSTTGSNGFLLAFAFNPTLNDINVASHAVVQAAIAAVQNMNGAHLTYFSGDEIAFLYSLAQLAAVSIDVSGLTVDNAVADILAIINLASYNRAIALQYSGDWQVNGTITSSTCSNVPTGPVAPFTVTVIQDGIYISVDTGGTVLNGTILDNTATWSGTYPAGAGTNTETGTATVAVDGLSVTGTVTWQHNEPGISCGGVETFTAVKL